MKQHVKRSLLICAVAALACGGCAKSQAVKQDQAISPVVSRPATAPAARSVSAASEAKQAASSLPASSIHEQEVKGQSQAAEPIQSVKQVEAALEKIFFDFDSYALSPQARDALAKNAQILKQKKNAKILIEGHCDELGSDDYNLALGERRANAALNYLESLGVPSSRLSMISYGKEKPAVPGSDEAARAQNRRDEFVITSN